MDHPLAALLVALGGVAAALAALAKAPGAIYRDLNEQLKQQRTRAQAAEAEAASLRQALANSQSTLKQLRRREGRLLRSTSQLATPNGLGAAFDHCSDGIVFALSEGHGTWTWVNATVCQALGLPCEEVVKAGWRGLIHPDDLPSAQDVELATRGSPVVEFSARFRRAPGIGGGWVWAHWWCPRYSHGRTVCIVKFGRIEGAEAPKENQ